MHSLEKTAFTVTRYLILKLFKLLNGTFKHNIEVVTVVDLF